MRARLWVACLAVSVGCASAPVRKDDLPRLAEADARILQGCYDCLLEARTIYRQVAVGKARPIVLPRLFETTLLIALREKELALDPSATLTEAADLAGELPPDVEAARYLAIVDAVPPDDFGVPRRMTSSFRTSRREFVPKIDAELAWLATGVLTPVVRDYLALAIDCAYTIRAGSNRPSRPYGPREPPPGAPPLIGYRTAICGFFSQPALYRLRENDPRFVEVSAFLARFDLAVIDQNGPGRAGERIAEVLARFGTSPSVTLLAANFHRFTGKCDESLGYYDRTIALQPVHEAALLGRVICLTHLERRDEAIAAATHLIDLSLENLSEALYWRAWNRHARGELAAARTDSDRAKSAGRSGEILTLAGLIEHDQDALDLAEVDLRAARAFPLTGPSNCTAVWYLGLVQLKRKRYLDSAGEFETAMGCYDRQVTGNRTARANMLSREDLDPAWRSTRLAAFDRAIVESTSQYHAAALNAATFNAGGGNIAAAKRLIEIAAKDPALAEPVGKLKEWLKDKGTRH